MFRGNWRWRSKGDLRRPSLMLGNTSEFYDSEESKAM